MKPNAQNLRDKVDKLHKEFAEAKKELGDMVRNCQHQYCEAVYDPIHTKAYTIPGDPPGTMGVDRQLPCYVPAKTEKRWRRECELCGDIQYTIKAEPVVAAYKPVFPNTGGL